MSKLHSIRAIAFVCLATLSIHAEADDKDEIEVRVDGTAVIASGVTPGASVVFFGVGHDSSGYQLKLTEFADVVTDDDRDGVARYELGRSVPPTSVWFAVDVRGARRGAAAGRRTVLDRHDLPSDAVHRGNGVSPRIVTGGDFVIFLVVRPGAGAWLRAVRDGGPTDDDSTTDGKVAAAFNRFSGPRQWGAAPDDFKPGDLVIAIDPMTLAVRELRGR